MIDIHCHILPGIDDGPSGIGESIQMARIAVEDGITTIVATPHVKDTVHPASAIEKRVADLNGHLQALDIPLKVLPGADVNAFLNPSLMKDYTIGETNYILIEFPHTHIPQNAKDILFNISLQGLLPIITHPERNASVIKNPDFLFELLYANVLVQLTAESLTGEFGPDVRECALYLLSRGAVGCIATDAHSCGWRPPVLSEGVKVAAGVIGMERALQLVVANPEAVITGRELHAA